MAASIFIGCAPQDSKRAKKLAARLISAGWFVWLDCENRDGRRFDEATEAAIAAYKVVVVLWSRASVNSDWVRAEAAWALAAAGHDR